MSSVGGHKRQIESGDFEHQSKRARTTCPIKKLAPGDYAFGWVAALPAELAAATAMLDEIHQELPRSRGDPNTYTLGKIGKHNIVIAGLPSDGYGTVDAATVANNMHRTFPFVQDFLMVGIAGGAGMAGNVDVRLGDIVVGDRVIQYDLGKDLDHQNFKTTAIHLRPSYRLRNSVAKLRSNHILRRSEVPALIHEVGEKYPRLKSALSRSSLRDLLFQDTCPHFEANTHCDRCDLSKLVERKQRQNNDPKVHYGVIASGNSLIRFPERRAQLVERWKALCFEMEGAGIIESHQCLVIRSICDYGDSHKNKLWQSYATTTATAYAKELILMMPIPDDQTSEVDELEAVLRSLSFDSIVSRKLNIEQPHASTCEWIFHHPDYLKWLDSAKYPQHHGFLWIRGKPGAGKSTLMKFMYDEMKNHQKPISFFFNARGGQLEKSTEGLYRSILLQLLHKLPTQQQKQLFEDDLLLREVKQGRMKWDNGTLQTLCSNAISQMAQQRLICLVDALDECDEDDIRGMVNYFERLGKLALETNVTLLICLASRHYPSISAKDGITLTLEDQEGHSRDLERYVSDRLRPALNNTPKTTNILLQKAAGVFMWAVLVVNILNKEYDHGRISSIKPRIDEIPSQLSDLFRGMLRRDNENMDEFLLSIQWILFARRPLKPQEYYYALLSGLNHNHGDLEEWNEKKVTIKTIEKYVLSSSKGLAEVTRTLTPTVQFIHESVRDSFLKFGGISEIWLNPEPDFQSSSHERLKQSCYNYIKARASDVESGRVYVYHERRNQLAVFQFASIAITTTFSQHCFLESFDFRTWGALYSLEQGSPENQVCDDLLYLMTSQSPVGCCEDGSHPKSNIDYRNKVNHYYPACSEQFHEDDPHSSLLQIYHPFANHVLQLSLSLECPLYQRQTPLMLAIAEWREDLVQVLLDKGLLSGRGSNARNGAGKTPLHLATRQGYLKTIRILLDGGANIDAPDDNGSTPLHEASKRDCIQTVQLLLDYDAQIHTYDNYGETPTPLHVAAVTADKETFELLLYHGARVDISDNDSMTPMRLAVVTRK
ncbi:hypothetical protein F5Y08DRAFT_351066 [Xylaria arbuscula]|nr:hypothetical protein F5Y08DRAFT_351066 [Xylaria arbuscula]